MLNRVVLLFSLSLVFMTFLGLGVSFILRFELYLFEFIHYYRINLYQCTFTCASRKALVIYTYTCAAKKNSIKRMYIIY